jgi:alpha-tubulin suppressor-like RCC1 family protein
LDSGYVTKLVSYLDGRGIPVFYDGYFRTDERWFPAIKDRIDGCSAFVLIMTPESEESQWVEPEYLYARRRGKPIVALLLRGEPLWDVRKAATEPVPGGQMPSNKWVDRLRAHTHPVEVDAWAAASARVVVMGLAGSVVDPVAIAAGQRHSLIVHRDGHVTVWGGDRVVRTVPAELSDVVSVAAGFDFSLALDEGGRVHAWGHMSRDLAVPDGVQDVVAVSAGYAHALALRHGGQVIAWGDSSRCQTAVPDDLHNVIAVSAGESHNLALCDDGHVVAWGNGGYAQTAVPPGLADVTGIAAGSGHSLAIRAGGRLVGWGRPGPAAVPDWIEEVAAVVAGHSHNLAIDGGGRLVAWDVTAGSDLARVPDRLVGRRAVRIAAGSNHNVVVLDPRIGS